jgi:hypothetical protein
VSNSCFSRYLEFACGGYLFNLKKNKLLRL